MMRSVIGDFVQRTSAAKKNGNAIVRKMTVRCGGPYGWKVGAELIGPSRTGGCKSDNKCGKAPGAGFFSHSFPTIYFRGAIFPAAHLCAGGPKCTPSQQK